MKKIYIPAVVGLAAAIGLLVGGTLNFTTKPADKLFTSNSKKEKLNRLIDYIEYEYVDKVNTDSIVDVTVNNILDKLDPHSVYIAPEEREELDRNMQGDFVGVGISFYMYRDTLAVLRVLEDGPGQKAGLQAGDRILKADLDTLYGKGYTSQNMVNRLQGPENTPVELEVYRRGASDILHFKLKRARVPIKSVDAAYMITDKLGYIKVNRFAETTFEEFKIGLNELLEAGMTALVLDLRDNTGGYLGMAERMADEFLEKNKVILFTKNKQEAVEYTYATDQGDFEEGDIYVLINERSASASEIVAGALQDNDKGTIVGRRSYGKGLVQRELSLGDGSAVRLTVSRYYTPTGRSIQRPYGKGNKEYYHEIYDRYKHGEMLNSDSIPIADSLKFVTAKGKVVYGGGGIIPDVFVPIDHSLQDEALEFLLQSALLNNFVFEYLESKRVEYAAYSDSRYFIEEFQLPDSVFEDFKSFMNRNELIMELESNKKRIMQMIKATIGLQLFDSETYIRILNQEDQMLEKVLQLQQE